MYVVKSKNLYSIKGLPFFSTNSSRGIKSGDCMELFVSNDGNMLLAKILQEESGLETQINEGKIL